MLIKKSPLVLVDFAILNCDFKFIPPKEEKDISALASEYVVDVDFAIVEPEPNIRVFVKVSINKGEEKAGYSIFVEGASIFNLSNEQELSEQEKIGLIHAAVGIGLNNLRGFVVSLTSSAPFGRYILPSIDMKALFKDKGKYISSLRGKVSSKEKK